MLWQAQVTRCNAVILTPPFAKRILGRLIPERILIAFPKQGNRTSEQSEEPGEIVIIPSGAHELCAQRPFCDVLLHDVQRHVAQHGEIVWGVVAAKTASRHAATAGKVAGVRRRLETYVSGQSGLIIDYATAPTARRNDVPISTVTTESTVQRLLHRRMSDNQQMRWSPRGAHLKLKVRTAVVNGTLNTCSRSTSSVGALVFIGESCSNSMLAEQGSCSDYYASIPSRAPEAHAQQHHAERVCADLAAPPTIDVPLPVRGLHVDHAF